MKVKLTNTTISKLEPRAKYYDAIDTECPGLLCRVQPSGKKVLFVRYRAGGRRRYYRLADAAAITVAEARDSARQYLADVVKGADPMEAKRRPKDLTLEAFLKVYEAEATRRWHHESVARVRRCFPDLLSVPLPDLTDKPVMQYRNRRRNDGASNGTINRDVAALRGVLSRAADAGYIDRNPLVSRSLKNLPEDSGAMPRYLKPDELKRLYDALDAREENARARRERFNTWRAERGMPPLPDLRAVAFTDHIKPMVLLALNCGLRRGEVFNLQWDDVTLDGAAPSLVVRGSVAKSGKTRHIPLNRMALDTLRKWQAQGDGAGLVFPSPAGGRFDNINSAWRALVKAADLPGVKFHDCRHHFASMLVQRGVDLNLVREILGHADLALTLRYAHLAPHNAARAQVHGGGEGGTRHCSRYRGRETRALGQLPGDVCRTGGGQPLPIA